MRTKYFVAFFLALLTVGFAQAQDTIVKKNKEIIQCKIKEIGLDEVKYTLPDYPADLLFSIDKDNITKVVFENGKEMEFQKQMTNTENYIDNKKNALKLNFLSPIMGFTAISYERSLKPGRSYEAALGIIGLGLDNMDANAKGANIKFGYKFIRNPDFYLRGMRYAHILKGGYLKPELTFGIFDHDYETFDHDGNYYYYAPTKHRETVISGALQLVFGKQWIFDNIFLIDYSIGIGYGFTSKSDHYDSFYHYGYSVFPKEVPISFSSGLRIGFLIK